ncbi:MAG: acetyl-CoA hydrolase [Pseudomonadales bacterium]|nr:acetyl-CoA hydrolase [Pseudomonadales bacterium]NIX08397.1 acetyl-CoA hydrolase [Pseudomonadales bacterium]
MNELGARIEPGQRVFVAGSSNEPTGLLQTLAQQTLPAGVEFIQFPLAGLNRFDFTGFSEDAVFTTFFMTPHLRDADPERLRFLPMQMRAVYDYLKEDVDVVLLQIARNARGELCLGPNVDFVEAAMAGAKTIAAELNHAFVAPAGCPVIDPSKIDFLIETERPLVEMAAPEIDAAAARIGEFIAQLVRDGDCIQTGIGSIPAAILARLDDRNDLGMHGGLIDDGGMALIRAGNMTGVNKPIDTRKHIAGMALGSRQLLDWLSETPAVQFRGANYTHEVGVIRELPQFVSVNSAVEVDLFGQVNAEVAGGRQISGTGGSVDFMRAAKASPGGRSIVAMNATARGGTVSRIVPRVELVTALRTDVDIIVTEHGVAQLRSLSADERTQALIEIAAPEFRDSLREAVAG